MVYLLASTVMAAILTMAGWFATNRWMPEWGTQVMFVAGGVNLVASWISFVPLAWVRGRHVDYVPQAAMGGLVLRLLIAAFALLVGMTWGPWNTWALAMWMLAFYLSLLVVETVMAVRLVHRAMDNDGKAPA